MSRSQKVATFPGRSTIKQANTNTVAVFTIVLYRRPWTLTNFTMLFRLVALRRARSLNMQRIGESKWRPLELCFWPDQGALPAKGKEYSGLGYKRLRDKPLKAQEQQPAEA
ncbi:hypothetical protein QJQ45_006870 [Haematococcus lacustris]|nr:hypothetical protein QJQ45_006870 [Haematococcus lacustris]